jgi:hypothetical protein
MSAVTRGHPHRYAEYGDEAYNGYKGVLPLGPQVTQSDKELVRHVFYFLILIFLIKGLFYSLKKPGLSGPGVFPLRLISTGP